MGVFKGLKGLEKIRFLKEMLAVSKNAQTIGTGKIRWYFEIRIFQGKIMKVKINFGDHVGVVITGNDDFKLFLQSDIEVTLRFDENGGLPTCSVFFPDINWTSSKIRWY